MEIVIIAALVTAAAALCLAGIALVRVHRLTRLLANRQQPEVDAADPIAGIADMLADTAMVWQRLSLQCRELQAHTDAAPVQPAQRQPLSEWLDQLQSFCGSSRAEVEQAYQVLVNDRSDMPARDVELQMPDINRFSKETRTNVAIINDQLQHLEAVLDGRQPLAAHKFKVTLHKPNVLPHFLRKRRKMAEMTLQRSGQQTLRSGAGR